MRVFVQGLEGATITVECDRCDTVSSVADFVAASAGVDAGLISLSTGLRFLDSTLALTDCGVEQDSTLFANLELLGAGKKRKKKTYTTPKKNKHKKKKVKLAVLKYYKVDANDKVSRLRKECPNKSCGAGVFMAKHHNRTYCGRCGMTYVIAAAKDE